MSSGGVKFDASQMFIFDKLDNALHQCERLLHSMSAMSVYTKDKVGPSRPWAVPLFVMRQTFKYFATWFNKILSYRFIKAAVKKSALQSVSFWFKY